MTYVKHIACIALAAVIAIPTVFVATSSAGERVTRSRDRDRTVIHHHYEKKGSNAEAALIGGAVGLAAGLILGDSLNRPAYERPVYYTRVYPRRRPVYREEPIYRERVIYRERPAYTRRVERVYYEPVYGPPRPWTAAWYDYCEAKYRSFDPESGTFQPHRGPRRLCR